MSTRDSSQLSRCGWTPTHPGWPPSVSRTFSTKKWKPHHLSSPPKSTAGSRWMRGPLTGRHLSDGGGNVCLRAGVQVFALLHEVEIFLDSIRKKERPMHPQSCFVAEQEKVFRPCVNQRHELCAFGPSDVRGEGHNNRWRQLKVTFHSACTETRL